MNSQAGDFLDMDNLQKMQDALAGMAGAGMVLAEGRPLTRPSIPAGAPAPPQGADATALLARLRPGEGPLVPDEGPIVVPVEMDGRLEVAWLLAFPDGAEARRAGAVTFLQALAGEVAALVAKDDGVTKAALSRRTTTEMLRRFIDSGDVSMYVTDFDTGEILLVNRHYARTLGVEPEALVGKKCWEVGGYQADTFCDFCPRDKLLDEDGNPLPPHRWEKLNPATHRWLRCTNQALHWPDGRMAHMVTFIDITAERQMRDELSRLAYFDKHMDLPNILKLQQDIADEQDLTGQYLVCFDVSKLRSVNDAYGRDAGNALLSAVVDWVRRQNFGAAGLYRVGGDEFCLYYKNASQPLVMQVANAILGRFAEVWTLPQQDRQLQIISGVWVAVVSILPGTDIDNITTLVERTLDAARHSGGVALYNEEMDRRTQEHLKLEMALKTCVKNDMQGFDVHYQAIVSPAAGTWKGLEALCRWTAPDIGPVPPLVFIPEAEQLGLIRTVGIWVLETAIRQCKAFSLDEIEDFFLSVNITVSQLLDEQFVHKVLRLLQRYDFAGSHLFLEVTESDEMVFSPHMRDAFERLRLHGVRFSLDDFGTGYSSFNNLKNLPVSILKTEREFVVGIEDDDYMQYFFYTMTQLAHAADMKMVAEGVETRRQLGIMMRNGVDYLQGYYFSEPLAAAELEQKLHCFVEVDHSLYAMGADAAGDGQLFSGKDGWLNSPRLFSVLNQSMQILLSHTDLDEAFELVLAKVGEFLGVSHGFVFLKKPGGAYSNTHEWAAAGALPRKALLVGIEDPEFREAVLGEMRGKDILVSGDTGSLPPLLASRMTEQNIRSVVVLPMDDDGDNMGVLGFDDVNFREWMPEEVVMMRNLAMTMGSSLKRERLQARLRQNDVRFTDVMNHIGLSIMITDPETGEVIWANDTTKIMNQMDVPLEGSKCYESLYGLSERCEFCRVNELLADSGLREVSWEATHQRTGHIFKVNDSLVHWGGGKMVHFQYAMDITDTKQAQQQLEYFASTDTLTGAYNRNSLITAMRRELKAASEEGKPLSLVFVDIDRLKYANDTFGHGVGDELIKSTVDALRLNVRSSDLIGRYGGDEFIVLMPGCDSQMAHQRVENARAAVARQSFGPMGEGFSFSFGVVENSELPWQDSDRVMNAFINLADDRMRDYKKAAKARQGIEPEDVSDGR